MDFKVILVVSNESWIALEVFFIRNYLVDVKKNCDE